MKKLMALMALALLTACDSGGLSDAHRERGDSLYKSAMDDYRAGRIDPAIAGFRRAVRKDPTNASARFQLACLLQDSKADYQGAFCGYNEYLSLEPDSDKAQLARVRLAKCELELAKHLATKHGLADKEGFVKENAALKADLRTAETRIAMAEKEIEALRMRVNALGAERTRLLAIVKGTGGDGTAVTQQPSLRVAKDLLEEDEGVTDRIAVSADAAALRADAADGLDTTGSSLLPPRTATTAPRVEKKVEEAPRQPTRKIPETYVVQEGDTLYGVAKRFYGRLSAWRAIRDMNKALISSDNRLHVGDTLRMPQK